MHLFQPVRGFAMVLMVAIFAAGCTQSGHDANASYVQEGGVLYEQNCRSCHGGATGGSLRDIPPPHNVNGHTWHHQDCLIREIVRNGFVDPDAPPEKPRMPAFRGQLTEMQVNALLAYMKTWWTDEQRAWQAQVTRQSCTNDASAL